MENSLNAPTQYCEKCGAPILKETVCSYCSDARILAERQQMCRDFLEQMNKELEALPGGMGWLILLIWWGIPLLIFSGIWLFPGRLHFLVWVSISIVSVFATTVIAGAMRGEYRRKIYVHRLASLLDQFLVKNQITYDYMLKLANLTFPEKSAIRELMAEGKKLEHLLQ
jgi:hypothetical protein